MAKKVYILNTIGINLPNYDRKDLKVGMSVSLDEKTGDKFADRGFLTKANAAATKSDNDTASLKKELADLKKSNASLKKELAELKK